MTKPRLFRRAYFLWLPLLGLIFAGVMSLGLPQILWSYSYLGPRTSSHAEKLYLTCSYVGPFGLFIRDAQNHDCSVFRFFAPHSKSGAARS